jgi:hypothetical protein
VKGWCTDEGRSTLGTKGRVLPDFTDAPVNAWGLLPGTSARLRDRRVASMRKDWP